MSRAASSQSEPFGSLFLGCWLPAQTNRKAPSEALFSPGSIRASKRDESSRWSPKVDPELKTALQGHGRYQSFKSSSGMTARVWGEGNGTPLQCPCLETPRDGGAWWAAVYGVAQSWTQLKRLSSSSSNQGVRLEVLRHCPPPKTVPSLCDAARAHRTGLRQDGSHIHLRQGETQAPQSHSGPRPGWAEQSSPQINWNETRVTRLCFSFSSSPRSHSTHSQAEPSDSPPENRPALGDTSSNLSPPALHPTAPHLGLTDCLHLPTKEKHSVPDPCCACHGHTSLHGNICLPHISLLPWLPHNNLFK